MLCLVFVSLVVKLDKKWYLVCFGVSFEIGGNMLNVLVDRKIILVV